MFFEVGELLLVALRDLVQKPSVVELFVGFGYRSDSLFGGSDISRRFVRTGAHATVTPVMVNAAIDSLIATPWPVLGWSTWVLTSRCFGRGYVRALFVWWQGDNCRAQPGLIRSRKTNFLRIEKARAVVEHGADLDQLMITMSREMVLNAKQQRSLRDLAGKKATPLRPGQWATWLDSWMAFAKVTEDELTAAVGADSMLKVQPQLARIRAIVAAAAKGAEASTP